MEATRSENALSNRYPFLIHHDAIVPCVLGTGTIGCSGRQHMRYKTITEYPYTFFSLLQRHEVRRTLANVHVRGHKLKGVTDISGPD